MFNHYFVLLIKLNNYIFDLLVIGIFYYLFFGGDGGEC